MKLGNEILLEKHRQLLAEKRLGVLAHAASVDSNGRHIIDVLTKETKEWNITAIFGPEHGLKGAAFDMEAVPHTKLHEIPLYSLYGETFASLSPTPEMLSRIDLLIIDLQDIGTRYYTYAATMALCIRACLAQGKEVVVCDRPNPINGVDKEGGKIESEFRSFVGMFDIPVRHAMTIGEIAKLATSTGPNLRSPACGVFDTVLFEPPVTRDLLHVIPMSGWNREWYWDQTGLKWINPSPNMRSLSAALLYPGMCLLEGTNVSEGRGTHTPFETIGAPWIDGRQLAKALRMYKLSGIDFESVVFTPTSRKFLGERCEGLQFIITNRSVFKPYLTGFALIHAIATLYPNNLKWRREPYEFVEDIPAIDLLTGNNKFRKLIDKRKPFEEIVTL